MLVLDEIQNCFDVANIKINDELDKTLRVLHTVKYSQMHKALREELLFIILNALQFEELNTNALNKLENIEITQNIQLVSKEHH